MNTRLEDDVRKRIIQARKDAKLERGDLAKALSMEYQSYSHYERGRFAFTVEMLFHLSRILDRSVQYFLGIDCGLAPDEDSLLVAYREARSKGFGSMALELVNGISKARIEGS